MPAAWWAAQSMLKQALNEAAQMRNEAIEVVLQVVETCCGLERLLVHVEPAIDLDLQTVAAFGGATHPGDQRHTLERIVACHRIPATLQIVFDDARERGVAGRAVAIAQHEID